MDVFQLVLKPLPEAAKEARDLIEAAFGHWGLETYEPRLVVTELFTNAARASSPDQHVVVRAFLRGRRPVVEVWDQSGEMLVMRSAELDAEGGRGLFIIDAFVADWGVRPLDEGGKVVWAECRSGAGDPGGDLGA